MGTSSAAYRYNLTRTMRNYSSSLRYPCEDVAIARSILVIIWHLFADPAQRYLDLGVDHHTRRIDISRKSRDHIRQLEALGFTVTIEPAA